MKHFILFLFVILPLKGFYAPMHEYYISITTINHNIQNQSLEFTFKFFTDDFEKAVEKDNKTRLFLGTNKEHAQSDSLITDYIDFNFETKLNDKIVGLDFLGKEVDIESTWVYAESFDVSSLDQIEIYNNFLTKHFRSQRNIVHITQNQTKKKSLFFSKGNTKKEMSY